MNSNLTKTILNNASESVRRKNPHLFNVGKIPDPLSESIRLGQCQDPYQPQEAGKGKLVISLVSLRSRKLDRDNLVGSFKWLQDAIAWSLQVDDGDDRIEWQYAQLITDGEEGVMVRIETMS